MGVDRPDIDLDTLFDEEVTYSDILVRLAREEPLGGTVDAEDLVDESLEIFERVDGLEGEFLDLGDFVLDFFADLRESSKVVESHLRHVHGGVLAGYEEVVDLGADVVQVLRGGEIEALALVEDLDDGVVVVPVLLVLEFFLDELGDHVPELVVLRADFLVDFPQLPFEELFAEEEVPEDPGADTLLHEFSEVNQSLGYGFIPDFVVFGHGSEEYFNADSGGDLF